MRPGIGSMPRSAVLAAAVLAACFLAGLAVAPVLETKGVPGTQVLRELYSPLCHQLPARSFCFGGRPLPVCARCVGLYGGGVSALFLAWLFPTLGRRIGWRWLAMALLPTIADASARLMGWPGAANSLRLLMALPGGLVAGLLLAEGLADLATFGPAGPFSVPDSGPHESAPGRS